MTNDKTFYQPGRYLCHVTRQAMGKTSTDKPQFILSFMVDGQVDPNDPDVLREVAHQYERSMFRVITDKTIPYLIDDLDQLGFQGESFAHLDPDNPGCHDFTGLVMNFECTHSTYEGTTREQWGLVRDGSLTFDPLDDKELRKLDAMFGKALKGRAKPARPAEKAPAIDPDTIPEKTGDEIPF